MEVAKDILAIVGAIVVVLAIFAVVSIFKDVNSGDNPFQ